MQFHEKKQTKDDCDNDWFYNKITPQDDDPYFSKWHDWGRFEKCCWLWASENAMLYRQFGPAMKFELLLKDYEYLKSNLLDVLQLDIAKSTWEKERHIKSKNRTVHFVCEPYRNWPAEWQDSFWKICGEMMEINGYNLYAPLGTISIPQVWRGQ